MSDYKYLGNLSAAPDWTSIKLECHSCRVEWIGCWDNAACPQCGNHDAWDELMLLRKEVFQIGIDP